MSWSIARAQLRPYLTAVLAVAAVTAAIFPFRAHLNTLNLALLYLIVVTAVSVYTDTWPSVAASVLAFLCFDFFYIPPFYTFTVARPDHVLALFVFLGIAILVTQLADRTRNQTAEKLQRGQQTATLYELSTALIGEVGLDATLTAIVRRVRQVFALDSCAIVLQQDGELVARAVDGELLVPLDHPRLVRVARAVVEKRQVAEVSPSGMHVLPPRLPGGTPQWRGSEDARDQGALLFPIATAGRELGVLVVGRRPENPTVGPEESQLLSIFANQAALAIERSFLTEEQTRAEVLARSDELKSALLSAVSHDLRTPLASIKASATSLLQADVCFSDEDRQELLEAIDEEADRLNQFVANILDLTRIEAGALKPERDWYNLGEIINAALDRTARALQQHPLVLDLPAELPPQWVDYIEIEQVLINLLENAAKYSPPDSRITLSVRLRLDAVEVAVRDQGIGIPPGEEERIFDKFYRVENPHRPIGSGVGLAICRGFVEAHGGRIWATRNPAGGTAIRFTLPAARERQPAIVRPNEAEVQPV